jgi:hypothetical protein
MKRSMMTALAASALSCGWASSAFAEPITGTIVVVGTVTMGSNIPTGTKVSLMAEASIFGSTGSRSVSETVQVKNTSGKATVTLTLPYAWKVKGTPASVTVSFSASASGLPANPSSFINVIKPLPPTGTTQTVNLPAAI